MARRTSRRTPYSPRCDTIADLLQAFLALRSLRTDARPGLDAYYTSKLLDSDLRVPSKAHGHTLAHTVRQVIDELRTGSSTARPAFAGRIFRMALRDEPLTSTQAASQALAPFWAALSRLAARGHWLREHRPLRDPTNPRDHSSQPAPPVFPFVAGDYQLTVLISEGSDLTSAINMMPQRVVYPLNTYPEICEFAAMAGQLKGGQTWSGKYFFGYTYELEKAALQFAFRSRQNGITIDFSVAEWTFVRQLFTTLFQKPDLRPIFEALTLAYGEI